MKFNMKVNQISKFLYPILVLICFFPFVTPPLALALGLIFALVFGSPFPKFNKKTSKYLLQVSVVGLGFGMHLQEAIKAGGRWNYIYHFFGDKCDGFRYLDWKKVKCR